MTEPAQLVRFLKEARDAAGGTSALAQLIAARQGWRPDRKTISSWLRGERQPRLDTLLAIVAELHGDGVSLDRLALADQVDQRPLTVRVAEQETILVQVLAAFNDHLASHGYPPLEIRLGA